MKTVTFAIQKGGTGKTSISVSVAIELATEGKKVLLIDADPQGNASTWILNRQVQHELCDVLRNDCRIEDAMLDTGIPNMKIIPTAGLNGELKEYSDNIAGGKLARFKNILKGAADMFDYCIIDTSPNFGNFEQSIFYATNEIVAVLQLDEFSKDGLQIFISRLKTFLKDLDEDANRPSFNKIVFNAKNDSFAQHNALFSKYEHLREKGYDIFSVPQDQAFKHAQTNNLSVQELSGKPDTKKALKEIAESLE